MMAMGLPDEVQGLLNAGFGPELKAMRSIGYKETCAYLVGNQNLETTILLIKQNSRRYAKRQFTWFNADPNIIWLEYPKKFVTISKYCIDFFK